MFDAHPAVMIPLESRFVQYLYYHHPTDSHWTPEMAKSAIEALETGFEPLKLHKDALLKQIEAHGDRLTLDRVCKLIYLHTPSEFEKGEIQILGDKNPRYTFFIPQLIRIFPKAKFIHLLRDYRDNVVSVQRAAPLIGESGNTYYAMGRWCLYNRFVEKCQKREPEKFIRLHFEMLIMDPAVSMKKLCRFLELPYLPDMLNYQEGIGPYFKQAGSRDLHHSLQNPFDDHLFGKIPVIIQRPVDPTVKVAGHAQSPGLINHVRLIGAAGQVAGHPLRPQFFQDILRAGHHQRRWDQPAFFQISHPRFDPGPQPVQVIALVCQRLQRPAAPALHFFGQLDHLVDGLLAGQAGYKLGDDLGNGRFLLSLRRGQQDLDHHRDHHLLPALPDKGHRAIKIKQSVAEPGSSPAGIGIDDLYVGIGKVIRWICICHL